MQPSHLAVTICHLVSPVVTITVAEVDLHQAGMDTTHTPPRHELELLTESELAALLKVCRRQLYKWRIAGLIPSFKLGRAVRFRASEVLAALERHRAS